MARLVVIGGGAAGMPAASAARRTGPDLDVTFCEAGPFAAYRMSALDLSYAPPFAPGYDPVVRAAGQAMRAAVPTAGGPS